MLRAIGAALVVIGVFTPILRQPIVGDLSYYSSRGARGAAIVAAALGAVGLNSSGHVKEAGAAAIVLTAFVTSECVRLEADATFTQLPMDRELRRTRSFSLANHMAATPIGLRWGWVLLFTGSVMLTVATLASPGLSFSTVRPGHAPPSSQDVWERLAARAAGCVMLAVGLALVRLAVTRLAPGAKEPAPPPIESVLELVVQNKVMLPADRARGMPEQSIYLSYQLKNKGSKNIDFVSGVLFLAVRGMAEGIRLPFDTVEPIDAGKSTYTLPLQEPANDSSWLSRRLYEKPLNQYTYRIESASVTFEDGTQTTLVSSGNPASGSAR